MSDFRDPNYRDPNNPGYRDPMNPMTHTPNLSPDDQPWSMATWGWIGGIAIAVLVLVVMLSSGNSTRTADDQLANPPSTIGQRNTLPAPSSAPSTGAPTMNRPAPAPVTPPAPAPVTPLSPSAPQP
jgi:hypothetical protein